MRISNIVKVFRNRCISTIYFISTQWSLPPLSCTHARAHTRTRPSHILFSQYICLSLFYSHKMRLPYQSPSSPEVPPPTTNRTLIPLGNSVLTICGVSGCEPGSASKVKEFLHQRLDSIRIDLEQDERMFLVYVAHIR